MAYKIGQANGYKDLLLALKGFLEKAKMAHNVVAGSNTGNGYVSAERASTSPVDETWTLTATSATNFTVTGSVSGAQAAATVGTPYDNGIVAFTIIAGSIAFVSGDSFTFDVEDGLDTDIWTVERWDTNLGGAGEYELILNGPGSGSDEIFVGIQTYSNVGGDYYNWKMAGFTGYTGGILFSNQPGCTAGRWPRMLLSNSNISYWFVANGRRFIVVAKISGVYEACYLGFILPYGLPTQFPYPLVVGGSSVVYDSNNERYSSTRFDHRAFVDPGADGDGVCTSLVSDTGDLSTLKILQGTNWIKVRNRSSSGNGIYNNIVWPYIHTEVGSYIVTAADYYGRWWKKLQQNIDGTYPVFPTVIMNNSPNLNIFGELQGCFAVPGISLAAEDTIIIGSDIYVVFHNTFDTNVESFWALKME